jgi:Mn2+/Fe2+ NRAMP family transporter
MLFSNLVALCIVVATAVTLNLHGITNIQTSSQAAEVLRPIAGEFSFASFDLGIIGTGLLVVSILAGSARVRGERGIWVEGEPVAWLP